MDLIVNSNVTEKIILGQILHFLFAAGPKDTPMEFVWEQTYDAKTGKGMPDL